VIEVGGTGAVVASDRGADVAGGVVGAGFAGISPAAGAEYGPGLPYPGPVVIGVS
jgi:hypothetical protein